MKKSELRQLIREEINQILKEGELSNSEKSAAIKKLGNTYPKLLAGNIQKSEFAKNFKRSKDNKINMKGSLYSKEDFMGWFKEPWAKDMFLKDDIEAVIYYFDKWPKNGSEVDLSKSDASHFVTITPTNEKRIQNQYPGGKIEDIDGLFIYQWKEDQKTRAIAHSLDDTWFLMTRIDGTKKFKVDNVLFNI
jgi:hypothetical protein